MNRAPLHGIRVCDFTWGKAGPTATMILADMGADVIKVEGPNRPDGSRGLPPRIDDQPALENSGYFNNTNRNKYGILLDMSRPEGRALAEKLIAKCDVVIESFSAHVMESWNLGYARLRQIRPNIVYVSMAGLGHTGPQVDYQTIGPTIQALSGLTHLSGLPDAEPAGWGYSYMDNTAGYYAALAVLLAVYHRRRTGEGQWVDLAQVEAATSLTGTAILDYAVNGRRSRRTGNRSEHPPGAPHGIYRCAGDDRWCAIAVFTDAEWAALCRVMGHPDWCRDPRFEGHMRRFAHQNELDALLAEWTSRREPYELMATLQAAGVSSGVVQTGEDLANDPQLRHLDFYVEADHALLGRRSFEGLPVRFSRTPTRIVRGAPTRGQHTNEVLERVVGVTADALSTSKTQASAIGNRR